MSLLVKFRDRPGSSEEVEEPELEEDVEEPNLLEGDVVAGSGLEVGEVVGKISSEKHLSIEEASRGVYRAIEDGRVRLVDPYPPEGLVGYLVSLCSLWFWLVVGFMGVVLVSIYILPQVYPLVFLRYGVGAVFLLFVPGFVLIEALYPKADELERLERFALDVGLSVAVVPLVGLVLNYAPWGIRLNFIFASIVVLVLALGVAGVWRKYGYWRLARGV